MNSQFKPTKGARLSQEQVDRYAPHILELRQEKEVGLKPMDLVDDARDADSPLHDYFEWDDDVAAERWRNSQAKYLLRHINTLFEKDDQMLEVRLWHSVVVDERSVYADLGTIVTSEELTAQMVARALREVEIWTDKYKLYSELEKFAGQIAKLLKERLAEN
jgi:hypothetical protein